MEQINKIPGAAGRWEELRAKEEFWQPENDGDSVQGVVCDINENGEFGLSVAILDKDDQKITLPCHIVLQNRLWDIETGQLIRVTYKGEKQGSNRAKNPTKIYKVERWVEG